MTELKAYNPTWRDQIARALLGDQRPEDEWRRIVEGLTGSSGLGQTGLGAIDFTPAGLPLAKQEAQQAAESGNWGSALLAAGAFIPGAKGALTGGKNVLTEAAEQAPKYIEAYHGSPHDFDRFSLDKIGTGEGAQAYGHGLYFAENEGVARSYRDTLSQRVRYGGKPFDANDPSILGAHALYIHNGDKDAALRDLMEQVPIYRDGGQPDRARIAMMAARAIERGATQPITILPGKMYQVRINADPEQFLDWDRPVGTQSEAVQHVFHELGIPGHELGRQAYGQARASMVPMPSGQRMTEGDFLNPETELVNRLREAGIPGIKYLDQGSRGAGEGSRNYVVFDDSLIEILKKYGLAGLTAGGAFAAGGSEEAQASDEPERKKAASLIRRMRGGQ